MNSNGQYYDRSEFDNIMRGRALLDKVYAYRRLYDNCDKADLLYRKALFAEYYNIPEAIVDTLLNYPHQERKQLCWDRGVLCNKGLLTGW